MDVKKALIIAVIVGVVLVLVFFFLWVILPLSSDSGSDSDNEVCSCSVDLDCGDFATQSSAQACFEYCGAESDFHRLDSDGNGLACEGLD